MDKRPIGIFDSGIGGLTVLREVIEAMPGESTVYLGDTARVPYGTKSAKTVTAYAIQNSEFLLSKDIKLLIVACNTATAYALPELQKRFNIPVVGVIEPGAEIAARSTRARQVGIIGTEGTIRSGAYFDAIKAVDLKVAVYTKACPLFVPLAEEDWADTDVARLTARRYLGDMKKQGVDVLLLGCTHYPLLKETISSVMGDEVILIDSAVATAARVDSLLIEKELTARGTGRSTEKPTHDFFVTDSPGRFEEIGRKFLRASMHAELVTLGSAGKIKETGSK
ncbi:Glutamate racemase [hydrothermal vent metagenome]|uniref:glutamate racemase n=1 Tax=hydrothermal vent metagenome TaxID=652676 RepID=A0A3B0QZ07_9ZZZZ